MNWLKYAFAIEDPKDFEPSPRQRQIVDRICHEVVRRQMTTPALLALETCRPLNFVGSQLIHFFAPFISALSESDAHQQFAQFLEHRGSIEFLCQRIETLETEAGQQRAANNDRNVELETGKEE